MNDDYCTHHGVPVHPSHDIRWTEDGMDPHNPGMFCEKCWTYQCILCEMGPDDSLALPCEENDD